MEQRIIKFKAKRLDNSKWVEGDLNHSGDSVYVDMVKVDPSTVCQFTGILDKDNKEIFENDLIENTYTKVVHPIIWNPIYSCYAWFDEERNRYVAQNFADYPSRNMLIAGNKFDRKEEK